MTPDANPGDTKTGDPTANVAEAEKPGGMLAAIERLGNKVPTPAIMFVYLIAGLMVLSAIVAAFGVSVTEDIAIPIPFDELRDLQGALGGSVVPYDVVTNQVVQLPDYVIQETTFEVRSLLSIEGLRFFFSSFVNNFAAFSVVAVTLVAMAGVGVAEVSGLMAALIRKVVKVAPPAALAFILILVGVLSSVATDAGYLILIPLGAAAFLSVGRHPLAGMAAAFAGVSAVFGVNLLITPTDSMMTEITNEAIGSGGEQINITANFYFGIVSTIVLAGVAAIVTARMIEPRLGVYVPPTSQVVGAVPAMTEEPEIDDAGEARGLKYAWRAFLGCIVAIALLTFPPGAPLRDAESGAIIGTTPFMASLIFLIALIFLICGTAYGVGAKTISNANDVVGAVSKTFASLGGLILMFLMIAQFIAFFNYTNLPKVIAVEMAGLLEQVSVPALLLLLLMIVVIVLLNLILPGVVPKWAIFAPVFIPIFLRLGVPPQTVQAAYRVGDSPTNVLTPLMVYFPFIVTIARRYDPRAGIGTIIALMIPYAIWVMAVWLVLFAAWFLLGIPLGPDSPVKI
jgi:aminobenzoyl-glutamate transport protein